MPDFQHDPVTQLSARLVAGMLILGIACVLTHLTRYRGRLSGRTSVGLLVAGIAIFPLLGTSMGMVLVFDRSKQPELCGSCHRAMQDYLDDMRSPDSKSLAAVHYKNRYIASDQCYECHTAYGLRGSLQAKAQGVVDIYRYYTRSFQVPITARHAYRNEYCLKCHGGAAKFLLTKDHRKNQAAMYSEKRSCMDCHGEAAPAHNLPSTQASAEIPEVK
jgi:nitrate/TMAO reductase-like tetraheme cytochrome c subunit